MPKSNVRRINGIEVTGTPSVGDIITAVSATAATWQAGGTDLTGAVILAPGSSTRNVIQAAGTAPGLVTPLAIRMVAGGTADLFQIQRSDGGFVYSSFAANGSLHINVGSGWGIEAQGVVGGVYGQGAIGVEGYSTSGIGVQGASESGNSGFFRSGYAANADATVVIQQRGASAENLLEFWNDAGAVLSYVDSAGVPSWGGGAGTVTSITAGTGLTGGTITTSGTIAVDVGTTASKILQLNGSAQIPAVDASLLTSLNGSNIASGTVPVARLPVMGGDSGAGGTAGLVPAPAAGDATKVLSGAGTWITPPAGFTPGKANVVHLGTWTAYSTATPLADARTAAASGDTIVVYPGTYNEAGLAANGVNWHLLDGVTIDVTSGSTSIFADGGNNWVFSVSGRGILKTSGTCTGYVFRGSGNSTVRLQGKDISTVYPAILVDGGGTTHVEFDTISVASSTSIGGVQNGYGTLYVRANVLSRSGSSTAALQTGGGTTYADVKYLYSTSAGAAVYVGAGTLYLNAHIIKNDSSTYSIGTAGGTAYITADYIENTGTASAIYNGGCSLYVIAKLIKSTKNTVTPANNSGLTHITADEVSTSGSSSYYAFYQQLAAPVYLNVKRFVHTGTNGIAVSIAGNTTINYANCQLVSHSGATDSLYAAAAQTITNYGTISANKALNANVTVAGNQDGLFFTPGRIVTKTTTYTANSSDKTILADATGAAFTVTLPTAVGRDSVVYVVKKIDAGANAVTVATTSSQTIDGAATASLAAQYAVVRVQSDGANWMVV